MRFLLLIFTTLSLFKASAHRGEILAIEDVKMKVIENEIIYSFDIENIHQQDLSGVRIEFYQNGISIDFHDFPVIRSEQHWIEDQFVFPKSSINHAQDLIQIEITQIFGQIHDWGGWDSPKHRQTNTLYSEFYVDAPWRMKRADQSGVENDVPVHFFLHDADLVTGYTMKIDYVDIKIKNASANTFGSTLLFDSLSSNEIQSLFSCHSTDNPDLNEQGFNLTAFSATSNHTIDFDGETDFIDDFVSVDATYWYFTFNIPGEVAENMEDVIDIEVTIAYANTLIPGDDVISMRVFRSDTSIPSQTDFYRGDTHLHSMFTQNDAEIGLPLCSTKQAAHLIGLDWITTTDHTSDFDNYGNGNIHDNWDIIRDQTSLLNAEDSSMIYITGQEVAVNNSNSELVHMLVYPSFLDPYSLPFLGDGNGDISATSVSIDNVINDMAAVDAFSYCAHPFATGDKLPDIPVNGGVWNLGENGFPLNGDNFPLIGGNIICNDINAPSDVLSASPNELVKEGIKGSQIWNIRWTLEVSGLSGDELDPYDVTNSGSPMTQADTADMGFYMKRFRQGQEVVNYINQLGLIKRNTDPSILNWKLYYSAGSDAHGSFNSSNTDDFGGTGEIHNNAVGKLNTLVYCPEGMGTNGTNVLKALKNGNTTISDGPILSIGISTDGDNTSNEVIMGQDSVLNYNQSDEIFLNLNYTTTPEFGELDYLKFFVGTTTGEQELLILPAYSTGDHIESFNLQDMIEAALGGPCPTGEYLYIRAELQTTVSYTGSESIYRASYDQFHSFSNPIWINWDVFAGEENLANGFRLYPNPTNEVFNIEFNNASKYEAVMIYNNLGQLIIESADISPKMKIDLSNYAKGVYWVRLLGNDGQLFNQKIVKQ